MAGCTGGGEAIKWLPTNSRLEQLTKDYPARLIASEAVVAKLDGEAATPLGAVPVKGYAEPVGIWRLD